MSSINEWDEVHQKQVWGQWPNEHFVRFMRRHFNAPGDREMRRFLEIGCGAGAQLRFFQQEGYHARGFDSSMAAVSNAKRLIDSERVTAQVGVAPEEMETAHLSLPPGWSGPARPNLYDAVIDVCTLQHMSFEDARASINAAHGMLHDGGRMFSIMRCDPRLGDIVDGMGVRTAGIGDIGRLFARFHLQLEFDEWTRGLDFDNGTVSHWIIDAVKM